MESTKQEKNKIKLEDTENRLTVTRGERCWVWQKMVKGVNCMVMDVARLEVIIMLYRQISNYYVVYQKLIKCCIPNLPQFKKSVINSLKKK